MGGEASGAPPPISIATGVIVALACSLVQSLGLTIQRKSHLQNEATPASLRRRDWQRPLWLLGFTIYLTTNITGSVFQIGALPIVVLAPLGAVSLLWNAFFARILLGDIFSHYLVIGTVLIAGGAVLIAIFGVVPDVTHTLEELLALYTRPKFIVWITLQFTIIVAVVAVAHMSEARLERNLQDVYIALPTTSEDEDDDLEGGRRTSSQASRKTRKARRWSTPPAYLAINTDNLPDATQGPPLPSPGATPVRADATQLPIEGRKPGSRHVSFGVNTYRSPTANIHQDGDDSEAKIKGSGRRSSSIRPRLADDKAQQYRLWLGIAYGSASGTLSGLCLLFAKTGIELLILTVMGNNQFKRWESWMIVLALLVCELFQLWYLNKSLRLVGPTLICPLAFCFYNLSSIFSGLTYYNQWALLSPLQIGLMCLGIVVLLGGVWIVSLKSSDSEDGDVSLSEREDIDDAEEIGESNRLLGDNSIDEAAESDHDDEEGGHQEETYNDLKSRIAHLYQSFLADQAAPPRGFSVGIAASSPGFALRPQGAAHDRLHQRRNTASIIPSIPRIKTGHSHSRSDDLSIVQSPTSDDDMLARMDEAAAFSPNRPIHLNRTASEGNGSTVLASSTAGRDRDALNYRHRRKRSLAGDIYVGAADPWHEEPALESPLSPTMSGESGRNGMRRSSSSHSISKRNDGTSSPQRAGSMSGQAKGTLGRLLPPWTSTRTRSHD